MNYFMIGGDKQEYGPADAETVRQWIREGRANADTQLRAENEGAFRPLKTFVEFLPDLAANLPPGTEGSLPKVITINADAPVQIGHAFARAWHLCNEHFSVIGAATLMVWMALTTCLFVPFAGPILSMLFTGPLFGGLFMLFLKLIREGDAAATDLFVLIRDNALSLALTSIVSVFLTQIATACCCVIPGFYLEIAWLFGVPIVADQRVNFWAGLEISRRVITPQWFRFCGLFVVAFLPVVVFHFYMTSRMMTDFSPYLSEMIKTISEASGRATDPAQMEATYARMKAIAASYTPWALIRQLLLLVSLPLGIGSFAFVYEDFFGRKK